MPTWRNDGASAAFFPGVTGKREPWVKFVTEKYPDVVPTGFTLVSHAPRKHKPLVTLHDDVLPVSISSGLAKYSQLEIQNGSGAAVTVEMNEDSDNTYSIPSGESRVIDQDHEVDALSITGSGSTAVKLYGYIVH